MIPPEFVSGGAVEAPPPDSNLLLADRMDLGGLIDQTVKSEIARAFAENRAFSLLPSQHVIESLRRGVDATDLLPDFYRLLDRIIEQAAHGDQTDEQRLKDDGRLCARLINALTFLHRAIASAAISQLETRRYVVIREVSGTLGLQSLVAGGRSSKEPSGPAGLDRTSPGKPILARIGKGPQWAESPTIYLSLRIFDILSAEQPQGTSKLFDSLVQLLLTEERAIETGYSHTEKLSKTASAAIDKLTAALVEAEPTPEITWEEAIPKHAKAKPLTEKSRGQFLAALDARDTTDESTFNYRSSIKAIGDLQKLARRYKKGGDRASLREVVRLVVAASGHDLHEVRNSANIMLERIFAPKEYDAPVASDFATVSEGGTYTFSFPLAQGKHSYVLRIFHGRPVDGLVVEDDIECEDVQLVLDPARGVFVASYVFAELGSYDFLVYRKTGKSMQWVTQRRCSGRINVIPNVAGEIVLEIFPDIHGHSRMYWKDGTGHPGLVYNENGEIIRLGRFSDITAHLQDLKSRYRITAIYLLGVQQRGANRQDWAPEATSPSPFAPMSLTVLEPSLGGKKEFDELVDRAHALGIRVIVDIIPHLNRHATEIPEDWRVHCYDGNGQLVVRASTDGKFGSWNDGALMNYRKFAVWEWLTGSVVQLIKDFDIDGIRFDSAHAVPIMMKRNNYRFRFGETRHAEELVEGSIIVNDRENDQLVTTGYYDSACRDLVANPFQTYLVGAIHQALREKGKRFFV